VLWKAEDGGRGKSRQATGRNGRACEVLVPVGTRVFDADTGERVADLTADGQRWVAAVGGKRGLGNLRFKSSTNQAPRQFTEGGDGEARRLLLELRLMADVGLLGFPNAGKSTLISRVSAARPRIASYPFTTLVPSLGVVDMGTEGSFVVADIPGLIEGASEGAGLGHRFLRHVKRTRLLLHLVSLAPTEALSPLERYTILRRELAAFDTALAQRPEFLVLTQADTVDAATARAARKALERASGGPVLLLSAVEGTGLQKLKFELWQAVRTLPPPPDDPAERRSPAGSWDGDDGDDGDEEGGWEE
jgi:GTP-binding protein